MSLIKSLLFTLLLAAAAVQASTRDEIERLWNPQGMAAQPAQPAAGTSARTEKPAPRWFRLSNGRQVIEHINDNMNDATRQIAAFQSQVQVQQDALLVVDRQMSYMRQQLSARMLSRYQNNYHFGGSTL
ncbi:TPA: hypothetical protein J1A80_003420 [Escherichia coli]|nr:hypothetical protein [Escherichia coli]